MHQLLHTRRYLNTFWRSVGESASGSSQVSKRLVIARCDAARPTAGRHLPERFRTGRDRAGPVSQSLRIWPGGSGLEASQSTIQGRPVQALDQGQEAKIACDDARQGYQLVKVNRTTSKDKAKLVPKKRRRYIGMRIWPFGPLRLDKCCKLRLDKSICYQLTTSFAAGIAGNDG
jgi:hypothetical protein